ncbi:hypothetical protein HELRODRAFT_183760 [Helobdella robusta]|uniref:Uncharacterized protein n=1 Tax=Helobdella robusta TaxID=6412 RepID=T1FK59_HELRO|nr:hypothetical protein HELRODRAFT_183760 [Helobdella robusta]ESO10295.1 hypothetical protein HELRODRAFT_183760 [Helobdella robusta]
MATDSSDLPSEKQLENVEKLMNLELRTLFVSRHEYRIYTKDVEFENKWNPSEPESTKHIELQSTFYVNNKGYVYKHKLERTYIHVPGRNLVKNTRRALTLFQK